MKRSEHFERYARAAQERALKWKLELGQPQTDSRRLHLERCYRLENGCFHMWRERAEAAKREEAAERKET